jgi:hypothetical protein
VSINELRAVIRVTDVAAFVIRSHQNCEKRAISIGAVGL